MLNTAIKTALIDYLNGALSRNDDQEYAMAMAAFAELGQTPDEVTAELDELEALELEAACGA